MADKHVYIGSRASKLALTQSEIIRKSLLSAFPGLEIEIKQIKTTGDKILDLSLSKIGGKGLFTKELEEALLKNDIDIAVHSMKDLPTEIPDGLRIAAATKREDACDILVSAESYDIRSLPANSKVGTSSLRRKSQLLNLRSDLQVADLRGNLDTRIRKLQEGLYDAIIVAHAGVKRLGLDIGKSLISFDDMLPQAGQGALGIEIREGDTRIQEMIELLNHTDSSVCVDAERSLLAVLEGGCQVPIGVYAQIVDGNLFVRAGVFSLDGKTAIRGESNGSPSQAVELGAELANELLGKGAKEVLCQIQRSI